MKNRITLFCTLFFFLLSSLMNGLAAARIPVSVRFDKISQAEGLSGNHVHCIYQEKAGWMWFGTSLGLNRYDGYRFINYRSDVDGMGTLRGELVRCVFEDKNNSIWVGTELGGLNLFDRNTEQFSHYYFANQFIDTLFSVNTIVEDPTGRIWVGTDKGVAFLADSQSLQLLPLQAWEEAGSPEVMKLFISRDNIMWIGTMAGLFVYDLNAQKGQRLALPDTSLPYDEINSLFLDSDNTLWIGSHNNGVYFSNLDPARVQRLESWIRFDRSETIRTIVEDNDGVLWFGTRGGLVAFEKKKQDYATFLRDEEDELGLSLNSVLSLCVDSKGDLWVGTRGGINFLNKDKQAFLHLKAAKNDSRFLNNAEVYCFFLNGNDLLIGTENGGVNIYNRTTKRFRYLTTREGISGDCIKAFAKDEDTNTLFVGVYQGGITVLDATTYQVKYKLLHQDNNPNSLKDNIVWGLLKDTKGTLWVVTNRGVQTFDDKTRTFTNQDQILPDKICNWIAEDDEGDIWVGGNELAIYSPTTGRLFHYNERTRDVIRSNTKNQYWVATRGHGLALYEKDKGAIRYLTQADGLCNNTIQSLTRDHLGKIWISTMNGLSYFDEKTYEFINFDLSDGLQDNQFNYGAALQTPQGDLVYGGIDGVSIFNPQNVRRNFYTPQVVMTGLKIFNQPVVIGKTIQQSISVAKKIVLSYKQNVFSFEFAALSYANSTKNQYMYKLEGFDKDWIYAGTNNSATYTNLDPGKYIFKVKGSNSNGLWNDKPTSIELLITPPFWKTWWFRLIVFSLILLVFVYIGNFYLRRAKLKNELLFEKTKARKLHELENLKLRFFTNISHEIRTPLTLILGPLNQVIEQGEIDGESKGKLQIVKRNADQLLKLINQLLDFRKLEAGKQTIHYGKGDIVTFVHSIVETFKIMASEKNIQLEFSSNREQFITWFDSDKIQKIVNNLLSNALKFTDLNGSVRVLLNDESMQSSANNGTFYSVSVIDNGRGIPEKNLFRIFDRFEQAPNVSNSSGSGIGLHITRDFVKLMGGEIDVESVEGQGTTFSFRLPVLSDADVNTTTGVSIEEKDGKENLPEENNKIILIAEDNIDIREYTASIFRHEYKVLEASNGKEAFELATKYIPDIIISDLLMPEMNGDVLCKKVKKDERTSHIPFILITAVNSKDTEKESLLAGADDYIPKPFDINILKLKIDNLLSVRDTLKDKYKTDFLKQPSMVTLASPEEKFLKKAVDIIEKYIDDPDFDIEKFASEIGVSRMQLYRKIEALTNMTVKEFIRDIRIKRAAQLLQQNKLSVSEIVYEVGFRDLAYFRKCFREQFGTSPSDYAAKFK